MLRVFQRLQPVRGWCESGFEKMPQENLVLKARQGSRDCLLRGAARNGARVMEERTQDRVWGKEEGRKEEGSLQWFPEGPGGI